ncbi:hypothetical protein [Calothrix sp. NIES-2098]|uniref:hypothetical protein n=1 Tax=Calothrix sp. NIES-2098 TaxID=1954171 RepID=UPI000B5F4286|nr:hypothetical protein NIES2098_15380 [Calothrix sp. NIES-2098]
MQVIEQNELFTEVSAEESAIVSGGDTTVIQDSTTQKIFALGASAYTFLLTGNAPLANAVLTTQWLRSFNSIISF